MEKKINAYEIKISVEDIKNFLIYKGGLDDIDSIYVDVFVNKTTRWRSKIGDIPIDKKKLTIQSTTSETIDELEISFFSLDEYNKPIDYELLTLTLCENDEGKLYFVHENGDAEIGVTQSKENENKNKNNNFESAKENNFESDRKKEFNSHYTNYTGFEYLLERFFAAVINNFAAKENNFAAKENNFAAKENNFESAKENNFESAKENNFAFSDTIFFGEKIDYLVYAISKKNEKFIDFNDAQKKFQCLFCIKRGNVWSSSGFSGAYINNLYDVVFQNYSNVKIDELKVFIRHKNYENFLKDKKYGENNNINELRRRGFFEIDVEKNRDETGFRYKLVDCNGNFISHAVDGNKIKEVDKLNSNFCKLYEENSEHNEFIERFNLALNNSDFVLKDKVKGIYLMETVYQCVFLGIKTTLVFTEEFLGDIKKKEPSGKFYILPKSQALKDIVDFILRAKCLPFESLSFINQEIVKSYDTTKHIYRNLDGKDMTTLQIYNLKIDPSLQSDKFSDDLAKLCKIDNGRESAVALIKLLSEIKVPNSDFKYQLSSFEDGKLRLTTSDILQIPGQIKNNTEEKTSCLEEKKSQALESQKTNNDTELKMQIEKDTDTSVKKMNILNKNEDLKGSPKAKINQEQNFTQHPREKFAFSDLISFGNGIGHLVYAISQNNKKFIDFNDAQTKFKYLFCIKRGNVWSMDQEQTDIKNIDDTVCWGNNGNVKIDELKIFFRHESHNNSLKDQKKEDNRNTPNNNIDLDKLRKMGYLEMDLKENEDENGFEYKLVDCEGNIISYAIDNDTVGDEKEKKLEKYCNDIYGSNEYKSFTEKFNLALQNGNCVLKDTAQGIYLTAQCNRWYDNYFVFLGKYTKVVFTSEFSTQLKEIKKCRNNFYILPKSQALKDIVDFILRAKCLPFKNLFFIKEGIVKSYNTKKRIADNFKNEHKLKLSIGDFEIAPNLQDNEFSDDLAKLCQINDGFQCAVALIELLSKIKAPNSDFKYQLSSFENGKFKSKTSDISQISKQIKNNTKEQISWLEEKKSQAFKSQHQPSENNNSNDEPFQEL